VQTNVQPSVHELLQGLSEGVEQLHDVGTWQEFLNAQARFHRYSYSNTLLILAQRPDAQAVAGFSTWRSLGRAVRRGERAIWIVAPMLRRSRETRPEQVEIKGFRRVGVFDISQTDGEPLAEICRPLLGSDDNEVFARLGDVSTALGFEVARADLPSGVFGDCNYADRLIRVSRSAAPAQIAKTLAHEIAHAMLHEGCSDRALAELEAESTAFVVCRHFGLDTSDYSLGYVTTWAGGTDVALRQIKQSCGRITATARSIIDRVAEMDERLAPLEDAA
jgi:antirestriction protein ArdC